MDEFGLLRGPLLVLLLLTLLKLTLLVPVVVVPVALNLVTGLRLLVAAAVELAGSVAVRARVGLAPPALHRDMLAVLAPRRRPVTV